ncbi:MAG: hypothetical protein ACE5K2_07015, partial [Candidatus Zixiibacteriota bacterium]
MTQKKPARLFESPFAFSSFHNWLKLLWNNKDIDRKFIPRALFILFLAFLLIPLRLYESVR